MPGTSLRRATDVPWGEKRRERFETAVVARLLAIARGAWTWRWPRGRDSAVSLLRQLRPAPNDGRRVGMRCEACERGSIGTATEAAGWGVAGVASPPHVPLRRARRRGDAGLGGVGGQEENLRGPSHRSASLGTHGGGCSAGERPRGWRGPDSRAKGWRSGEVEIEGASSLTLIASTQRAGKPSLPRQSRWRIRNGTSACFSRGSLGKVARKGDRPNFWARARDLGATAGEG